MTKSDVDKELQERFGQFYNESRMPVNQRIELDVCGCDYGGVSWATREEIDQVSEMLNLGTGDQLMDIGAGAGWPGLYLAELSGCDISLTDLPIEGLIIAAERAKVDGLSGACHTAVADGQNLPFQNHFFDALTHSDVLCCLSEKVSVLRECRRVTKPDGQMIFSVIYIGGSISKNDRAKAVEAGPPYIASDYSYEKLLQQSGWHITSTVDRTSEYLDSVRAFFQSSSDNSVDLVAVIGEEEFEGRMSREKNLIDCLAQGLIRRVLYQVVPDRSIQI